MDNVDSNEDPLVKRKVVVAVVTGTWGPNCHDETQYLVQLQKKYGVPYPYLIAGTPQEMWDKVPQAVNLNTWPATFFVGRDGKVKAVHSGFAAPASGPYHLARKEEFTSIIENLLKEKPAGDTVVSSAAGGNE